MQNLQEKKKLQIKKLIGFVLTAAMLFAAAPVTAAAADIGAGAQPSAQAAVYTDAPADPAAGWAVDAAAAAGNYGLMEGPGNGTFGFGKSITRAEFITMLCRMFGWEAASPAAPAFSDTAAVDWYYTSVETALAHNAIDRTGTFRPNAPVTREEMAVMLVRGLGYNTLAQSVASFGNPFADVTSNAGHIAIAADIGMTKGTGPAAFSPAQPAKREEAAAMLVRVYEKYIDQTDWIHGFYAISSYSQKELAKDMDAVSLGWSRMGFSAEKGAYLNTTAAPTSVPRSCWTARKERGLSTPSSAN